MRNLLQKFQRDENGVTAVEYAMIAGLIAVVIIGIVTTLGGTLKTVFSTINSSI